VPREPLPTHIGLYTVVAPLGSGNQGPTYLVSRPDAGGELVLKFFAERAPAGPAARDRLRRAGRSLAECSHPNLVRIVDVDLDECRPFIVTQRIYSLPVTDYAHQRRPSPREAAALVAELARAIKYLDVQGIFDKDLSPKSVQVDETGRPRLTEFGLSRLRSPRTEDGDDRNGESAAKAPRAQATRESEPPGRGPEADVHGLGIILYHLLLGRDPDHGNRTVAQQKRTNERGQAQPGRGNRHLPRSLERICEKALALDPDQRYRSATELERALWRFRARRWFGAAALAIFAALAIAVLGRF
jgi:serine/threonine-protein kinase